MIFINGFKKLKDKFFLNKTIKAEEKQRYLLLNNKTKLNKEKIWLTY